MSCEAPVYAFDEADAEESGPEHKSPPRSLGEVAGDGANGAADGTRTRNNQLGRLRLYQLNYCRMVGATGFEPATLCSQSRCATKLRYAPETPGLDDAPSRATGSRERRLPSIRLAHQISTGAFLRADNDHERLHTRHGSHAGWTACTCLSQVARSSSGGHPVRRFPWSGGCSTAGHSDVTNAESRCVFAPTWVQAPRNGAVLVLSTNCWKMRTWRNWQTRWI